MEGKIVKQGKSFYSKGYTHMEKHNEEFKLKKRSFKEKQSRDQKKYCHDYSEIEKLYLEFLTKRIYLGKDYRRQHIVDYLKQDDLKIENEYNKSHEDEVQIFEDESNISLSFSQRLSIVQKFSITEHKYDPKYCFKTKNQKYICIKTLARDLNCDVEEIHKTLRRHIKYVKEWEDVKLYSPHSLFRIADLDTILFFWVHECLSKEFPTTKNSIKHTAHSIAKLLNLEMFKASDYWLDYFINKYNIQLKSETPQILEKAAEAARNVKISNVIIKHLPKLTKSLQEKFAVKRVSKPFTYKKRFKNSEISRSLYSKIEQNSINLKINSIISKKNETKPEAESCSNSFILNNIIKQEPQCEIVESRFIQIYNNREGNDKICEPLKNYSINNLNIEHISYDIDNNKKKIDHQKRIETGVVPNIKIESYEHALKYLKPLEEFVILKSNFRAINYLNCLQNVLKELNKS